MVKFASVDLYRIGDEIALSSIHKESLSVGLLAHLSDAALQKSYYKLNQQINVLL